MIASIRLTNIGKLIDLRTCRIVGIIGDLPDDTILTLLRS